MYTPVYLCIDNAVRRQIILSVHIDRVCSIFDFEKLRLYILLFKIFEIHKSLYNANFSLINDLLIYGGDV